MFPGRFATLLLLYFISVAHIIRANGTPTDSLWTQSFGGNNQDQAAAIIQANDGGYLFAGVTDQNGLGQTDIRLVRTDSLGGILWMQTYPSLRSEAAYDMCRLDDGGFMVAGSCQPNVTNDDDAYLMRVNSQGDTLWTRTYGGPGNEAFRSVAKTVDGGFILAGRADAAGTNGWDAYLVKVDDQGNLQWSQTIGGADDDWANAITTTPDGGYLFVGETNSFGAGSYDIYVVKTDRSGMLLWWKTFGNIHEEEAFDVQTAPNKEYIIIGHTTSTSIGSDEMYLLKIDDSGNLIWDQIYQCSRFYLNRMMVRTMDEGFLAAAYAFHFGKDTRALSLVRIEDNGELLWSRSYANAGGANYGTIAGYWSFDTYDSIGKGLKRFFDSTVVPDTVSFSASPQILFPAPIDEQPSPHSTSILNLTFDLTHITSVEAVLYMVDQKRYVSLFNGRYESGHHSFPCDARQLPGGISYINFRTDTSLSTSKILVIK